jgi:hypothetical protein
LAIVHVGYVSGSLQKNYNIDVGPLKRPIPNIWPIFGIGRFNLADTNNGS